VETSDAAQIFAALSQETRLAVLRLLISVGPNGLPAGAIAERIGQPASTTSFHLSALERAGLTQSTRRSRQIVHAVRIMALRELIAFLAETCCGGRPELCGDIGRLLPAAADPAAADPAAADPAATEKEDGAMVAAFNVLFLCTHNAARSIMAEAILRQVGGGRFHAWSAGSDPAPQPMPAVIDRLRVLGHDVADLHTRSWNEFARPDAPRLDFIIALCDILEGQDCPDFAERPVTGAWPLPDPARFMGSDGERAILLNELYASLRRRIEIFVSLPFATLDRIAIKARLDEIGSDPTTAFARSS
jgi:protein-tyrosine-phosphatase/DNA-binding transcriptional ArsR family regulator